MDEIAIWRSRYMNLSLWDYALVHMVGQKRWGVFGSTWRWGLEVAKRIQITRKREIPGETTIWCMRYDCVALSADAVCYSTHVNGYCVNLETSKIKKLKTQTRAKKPVSLPFNQMAHGSWKQTVISNLRTNEKNQKGEKIPVSLPLSQIACCAWRKLSSWKSKKKKKYQKGQKKIEIKTSLTALQPSRLLFLKRLVVDLFFSFDRFIGACFFVCVMARYGIDTRIS